MIKKAEDAEVDTAEQSAIKLRAQQLQTSSALVVADQPTANGTPQPVGQLNLVTVPSMNSVPVSISLITCMITESEYSTVNASCIFIYSSVG